MSEAGWPLSSTPATATAAVVLAAGSSTRMGQNKLMLVLDGESLVHRAVRAAGEAGLDPIIVVLGHEADRVRGALAGLTCRTVINPDHARGKGTSLQVGIREAAATGAGAAVVMLADMPFVTAAMLGAVAACHGQAAAPPMVVSHYGEVHAPPILYARALFDELLALPGEACGKEMVRRHRHEAAVITWPEAALADVDVPEDYERIRAGAGGAGDVSSAGAAGGVTQPAQKKGG